MSNTDIALTTLGYWAAFGYILGSIPFGLLVARVMGLGNLREIGSGNIGATNVLRTGNKPAAALTLLLDGGKGALAVLLGHAAGGDPGLIAGLAAMIGHCFPVWLRFKGGKGVATFLGIVLALNPMVGLGACLAWLAGAFSTRISSVGALVASVAAVPLAYLADGPKTAFYIALMAALIFWRHRGNIARIRAGTEPKIGKKS